MLPQKPDDDNDYDDGDDGDGDDGDGDDGNDQMKDIGSSFKTKKTTRPIIQRWTFFPFYSPEIVPIKRGGRKMVNNFGINSGISGSLT